MTAALTMKKMTSDRNYVSFPILDWGRIKIQMLNWVGQFNIFCFLDNHEYPSSQHSYECLLGAGAIRSLEANAGNAFEKLRDFSHQHQDWLFGHFGYDLKNETESLSSSHPDGIGFPDLFFFIPEITLELNRDSMRIGSFHGDHEAIFGQITRSAFEVYPASQKIGEIKARLSREKYLETVGQLRWHIQRGDCYEINFCQEFYGEATKLDPAGTYQRLSATSPAPFAAFYRLRDKWLLCASPERYLKKKSDLLIAQPIKGTRSRDTQDRVQDDYRRNELFHSKKDRSENVMVVDLVRNDLSKVCLAGSVQVEELYGIYSFAQVHQMVSSVTGILGPVGHWSDIIQASFPMGSMTGAPKKRVLELIEQYENRKRGLFSGSVGYVSADGDFDFNVVIRSIFYNSSNQYLSYQAGSAITFYSDAAQEYEECLLKVAAIKKVLAE
jgi:para-aminobenzoate synthetase component 1